MKITKVIAREIYDSRGLPTVECEIFLENGMRACAAVPSGKSKGSHEAVELRDGGTRFFGLGVRKAIDNIENKIGKILVGQELNAPHLDQLIIELDGTPNKAHLGANATLGVSMALYRAQALVEQAELFEIIAWVCGNETVSLPMPLFNVINGGAHADNNLRVQEFMIVPLGAQGFRQATESSMVFYQVLKEIIKKKGKSVNVGDEGGFAPQFDDEIDALTCMLEAVIQLNNEEQVFAFALDIAATQFYNPTTKLYDWHGDNVTSEDLVEYYAELTKHFPIFSIEDGLAEDDWQGWMKLMQELGDKMQLVGDDLFATSPQRIKQGIELGAANAVLIKPNQIGTITETLQVIKLCQESGLGTVISHRSGETCDSFIADLAVGTNAAQIKAGGCARSERVSKYNRLLVIEDILMRSLLE